MVIRRDNEPLLEFVGRFGAEVIGATSAAFLSALRHEQVRALVVSSPQYETVQSSFERVQPLVVAALRQLGYEPEDPLPVVTEMAPPSSFHYLVCFYCGDGHAPTECSMYEASERKFLNDSSSNKLL
uniref:ARAD1C04642p n=1 Tax=Blastobotrys adeninivorans TaxID=409370 RepID=A0A060T5D3_BLAAD